MDKCSLREIAEWAQAEIVLPETSSTSSDSSEYNEDLKAYGVSIDTRTLVNGEIYMPIIGETHDGHKFIGQAFSKGACASFTDSDHPIEFHDKIYLRVKDCFQAFRKIAKNYRNTLNCKIIGITGSNGKTTSKDIISSVLSESYKTDKTFGNLNNQIGLPRTILDLNKETEMAIVEMGMSASGEIEQLADIARPDIAVITNVGEAHLQELKTRENIAKAKLEIISKMDANGILIYNSDSKYLQDLIMERKSEGLLVPKIISFGTNPDADYRLELIKSNAGGSVFKLNDRKWEVNLLGSYQMYNAAPAIIIGQLLGMDENTISRGLHVTGLSHMRSELVHAKGFDILVDCYNSSPQSLRESLSTASLLNGYRKKIAILGDMLELGENEKDMHFRVGKEIDPNVFSDILFYGPLSKYMMQGAATNFSSNHLFWFESKNDLVDKAKYLIRPSSLVLIKGSRSMRLEEVVESIFPINSVR